MQPNSQFPADVVSFTVEILNGKLVQYTVLSNLFQLLASLTLNCKFLEC